MTDRELQTMRSVQSWWSERGLKLASQGTTVYGLAQMFKIETGETALAEDVLLSIFASLSGQHRDNSYL